ncbi:YodC family protein [Aggregatibacter actinomycetemcomitans]|uniref:YodC family protein n=1 Tax=Aggregatibacter actinomycetemcomitans TaxID=714 RepID=UPI00197BD191|nr:DUF2158 domain-containing protein [Aggregatibacter actinomycetemcomitans]MBN6078619.1 DUF2158 domain-containing protein [Aggregatibacter actinomycetemcomitans]
MYPYELENKFEIGQIVRLKSGGPDMTIQSLIKDFSTKEFLGEYKCQWFAGKKLENGVFPEQSLELVDNENK